MRPLSATGGLGADAALDTGFDTWSRVEDGRAVSVRAFAALTTDASRLYEVDLLTGLAKSRGRLRAGQQVVGLAIALDRARGRRGARVAGEPELHAASPGPAQSARRTFLDPGG
jgi:hypothetical protein